ncbi:ArnT family glycosyltransferase [Chloroflexota bacterium]
MLSDKVRKATFVYLIFSLIEGLLALIALLTIITDPKNQILLGYSMNRLVLIGIILVSLIIVIFVLFNPRYRTKVEDWLSSNSSLKQALGYLGLPVFLLLILTLLFPAYRLEVFAARFTRIQPVLVLFELMILQLYLVDRYISGKIQKFSPFKYPKRTIFILTGTVLIFVTLFYSLKIFSPELNRNNLVFASGIPITSFQVFIAWVIFLLIILYDRKHKLCEKITIRWVLGIFLVIWISTTIIWATTPIVCTNDRPGPYPPNNICYPQINDAVYSIGSHYTSLGQGINNHWLTDKPLYMVFLAAGQSLFGQDIDSYLGFQIIIVALLPAILFLFARKYFGFAQGVLLTILLTAQGMNALNLYQLVDSVNVKVENTEVFTSLILVLLLPALFLWLNKPNRKDGPILTGGLLGIAVLTRFNPIFIAPIVILVVWIYHRKPWKTFFLNVSLFIITFLLVTVPWFISANDKDGNNFYVTKISNVISSRFGINIFSKPPQGSTLPPTVNTIPQPELTPPDQPADQLNYPSTQINYSGSVGIIFHFLNNEMAGIAQLPSRILFYDVQTQIQDPMRDSHRFFWKYDLTFENIIALIVSTLLFCMGLVAAWRKFGIAGFSALIIQIGYYLGNAFAQTSGGRYLEPVFWSVLLYFTLGLGVITARLIQFISGGKEGSYLYSKRTGIVSNQLVVAHNNQGSKIIWAIIPILLVGLSVPVIGNLNSPFPVEVDSTINEIAYQHASAANLVSESEWDQFLQDPGKLVVQGVAYNPRSYRIGFYLPGNLKFELMVLAQDHVYVSYAKGVLPRQYFSDGSQVILVGCKLGDDSLWVANRIIMNTKMIIQLDHEGQFLYQDRLNWICR